MSITPLNENGNEGATVDPVAAVAVQAGGLNSASSRYTDKFGPNVEQILCQASRVIRGRVPAQVRAELRRAVAAGVLGHLPKDGLKPEIFFHPDHKRGAIERQKREAAYSVGCIATVMATADQRVDAAIANLKAGA